MAKIYFYILNFDKGTFKEVVRNATETKKQYKTEETVLLYCYKTTFRKSELPHLEMSSNYFVYITDSRMDEDEMRRIFRFRLLEKHRKLEEEMKKLNEKISVTEQLPMSKEEN